MGRFEYPLYIITIEFTLLILGFLLNLLGIICSLKQRNTNKIRRMMFVNLSAVEMIYAVLIMLIALCQQYPPLALLLRKHMVLTRVLMMLYHLITFEFFNVMTFITLDRLASALYPIKYKIHMNQSAARKIIVATWVKSFCIAFPFIFLPIEIQVDGLHYSAYAMQGVFLLATIVTYGYIARILVKRKTSYVGQSQSVKRVRFLGGMKCKVPFLITSSFLLLIVVPNIVKELVPSWDIYMQVSVEMMSFLELIIDPMIYLFSSQSLRSTAWKLFDCSSCFDWLKQRTACVQHGSNDGNPVQECYGVGQDVEERSCYHLDVRRPRTETEKSDDTVCSDF